MHTTAALERLARLVLVMLLVLGVGAAARAAGAAPTTEFEGWPRAVVQIRTRNGLRHFQVGVADTPARQHRGLMFIDTLAASEGMWFPQWPPRLMRMWMLNTLISLDMLFVDERGRVACIAARTTPRSLDIHGCRVPVRGVLEISGGLAASLGVTPGDRVVVHAD